MTDELPRLYTLREVSERTGFALRTLERDCRAGRVAHVHRGRVRSMTVEHIEALIEKYTRTPEPDLAELANAANRAAAQDKLVRMLERDARRPPRR